MEEQGSKSSLHIQIPGDFDNDPCPDHISRDAYTIIGLEWGILYQNGLEALQVILICQFAMRFPRFLGMEESGSYQGCPCYLELTESLLQSTDPGGACVAVAPVDGPA